MAVYGRLCPAAFAGPLGARAPRAGRALSSRFCSPQPASDGIRFTILDERVSFQRYQTVYERLVRYPDGKRVSFDVFGTPRSLFQSVFVVPYDTESGTVTLLREYQPGGNVMQWGFIAGGFDPGKHMSIEEAARAELSEEARLKGGTLIPITGPAGVSQDKYSRNVFHMFLAFDTVEDKAPLPRDEEEYIQVVNGVTLDQVRKILAEGSMNVCSGYCGYRALDALANPDEIVRSHLKDPALPQTN